MIGWGAGDNTSKTSSNSDRRRKKGTSNNLFKIAFEKGLETNFETGLETDFGTGFDKSLLVLKVTQHSHQTLRAVTKTHALLHAHHQQCQRL